MSGRAFIFAGGGTGGHIYPGVAVAHALRQIDPTVRTLFLCSTRPLDARLLTEEGLEHRPIPAAPFTIHPLKFVTFARSWGAGARAARDAIQDLRREGARGVTVVAMGGFVAAPAARAAIIEDATLALVNLDAVPGKANRLVARSAELVFTATGDSDARGNVCPDEWMRVPPIVRRDAVPNADAPTCRERLGLDARTPTLFVTGASQGARSINGAFARLLETNPALFDGWQVFHQTGEGGDAPMREAYQRANVRAVVVPFRREMGDCWGAADLAVARSGAGTVAEAWASATPCVFLPYPYHRDQHQRANAAPLTSRGGAIIVDDLIDPKRNAQLIAPALRSLMSAAAERDRMRDAIRALGPANGDRRIAAELLA